MRNIVLCLGLVSAIGCTKSDFTAGSMQQNPGNNNNNSGDVTEPPPPPVVAPENPGLEEPGTDGGEGGEQIEFDTEFDTFLRQCIADEMTAKHGGPIAPRVLTETLEDYATKDIETTKDFETLADLILRDVVDADGLINYNKLRGELSVQWGKIAAAIPNTDIVISPRGTSRNAAMAFWSNIYNLLMIDVIVNNPQARNVSTDIGFGLFDEKKSVSGTQLSLNEIEKGIMRLGEEGDKLPAPEALLLDVVEPRLHYTIVCGAISCPRIRNFLYRADNIEKALIENNYDTVNSEEFFYVEDNEFLIYGGLFFFYPSDTALMYGANWEGLTESMIPACRSDIALIEQIIPTGEIYDDPYIWDVNEQL